MYCRRTCDLKILLTGSTGFIGSRLAERIDEMGGHELHRLIRYTAGGRWNFYAGAGVHFADLRDPDAVKAVVNQVQPQVIIHLAADSAVAFSFQRPRDVFMVNALGTIALAEAATELKDFKMFVHASTSEVYGNQGHFPIEEDARLNATSPYAAAKIAAEEYLRVQNLSYGLPILIVRPFNTYGRAPIGNQHFVVERAIVQALKEHRINLHNPEPRRDFLFREDHVQFYVDVLKLLDTPRRTMSKEVGPAGLCRLRIPFMAQRPRASTPPRRAGLPRWTGRILGSAPGAAPHFR